MKRSLFVTLLTASLAAQAGEPVDTAAIAKIRDEGLNRSRVMDTMFWLTDRYGPRLTGSAEFEEAGDWAVKQLQSWGVSNVRKERFTFGRGWSLVKFHATMLEPRAMPIIGLPKAWTPGTNGTVVADVVRADVTNEADAEKYRGKLRGKIVLTQPAREVRMLDGDIVLRYADDPKWLEEALSMPPPRGGGAGGAGGRGAGAEAPTGPQRDKNIRPPVGPNDDPLRMQVLAPILLSPHDPDTIYFGTQYLYRSRDRGDTWERVTADMSYNDKAKIGDIPHQLIITISESPKKKGLIYTGTDDGRLYASVDDGKEFRELTASLPKKQWIASVLASKHDEATVYVAQQGRYDEDFAPRIYKSTDYGKSFRSIAGNIPGGPINMIREDPVSPNVLYAANDFGVYVTTNGGQKWEVLGGNLPSVNVMDFIVHPRDRMLVIGTHGRGVWAIDVSKIGGK